MRTVIAADGLYKRDVFSTSTELSFDKNVHVLTDELQDFLIHSPSLPSMASRPRPRV